MAQSSPKLKKIENFQQEQQQLELILPNHNRFWQSSLFNEVYLQNDVPTKYKEMWEQDESGPFHIFCNQFVNLCEELKDEDLNSWSEKSTINKFIKPILRMLGYFDKCSPNQEPWIEDEAFSVKEGGELKTYKPDFIIVNDPKELKYISRKKSEEKNEEARSSVIVSIEAKYWGRIEDSRKSFIEDSKRSDKKDQLDATRSLDFDEQCLKYMEILNKDYGVLTDGKTWKLYSKDLSSDSYRRNFQFSLGHLMKHVNAGMDQDPRDYKIFLENAKYFYHFFSKKALFSDGGDRRFLDDLLEYSKKYVTQVDEDLKSRFVKAMAYACNGFLRSIREVGQAADLSTIRNVSESHLFNILFIKHCESRNVLPLRQSPGYRKISISNIIDKLEHFSPEREIDGLNLHSLTRMFSKDFRYSPSGTELYDRLLKLTKNVQSGTAFSSESLKIDGFRESIFSKSELAFCEKYKLTNSEMVSILFELGYCVSDVPGKKYQQIPYNFFSPRQLGSIYESFLEFKLDKATEDMAFIKKQWSPANLKSDKIKALDVPKVTKGDLFFTPDNEERKATGSFYTPDSIVQYILQKTLLPLVKDKGTREILALRICDPAMGSGHFLTGALNFLAKAYIEALDKEVNDDLDVNIAVIKRKLLANCIFGVDLNPRAVKLAKMSLWLESADASCALEELDDQLKVGDSLEVTTDFKFKKDLAEVMKVGFDAIVGNPPYIRSSNMPLPVRDAFKKHYKTATGAFDIYALFFEQAGTLLRKNGRLGFIVSNKLAVADYAQTCRELLSTKWGLEELIDFTRCEKIFADASVVPIIVVASSGEANKTILKGTPADDDLSNITKCLEKVELKEVLGTNNNFELFHSKFSKTMLKKFEKSCIPLRELEDVRTGIMGFEYWQYDKHVTGDKTFSKKSNWKLITPGLMTKNKNLWSGKEVRLYKKKIKYPVLSRANKLLSKNTVELFDSKKVVIRGVGRGIAAFYDDEGCALLVAVHTINKPKFPHFYTALFNSTLVNWIYCTVLLAGKIPQGSLKFPVSFIEAIPVRKEGIEKVDLKLAKELDKGETNFDKIDSILAAHYGISDSDIAQMKAEVEKTIPSSASESDDNQDDAA